MIKQNNVYCFQKCNNLKIGKKVIPILEPNVIRVEAKNRDEAIKKFMNENYKLTRITFRSDII